MIWNILWYQKNVPRDAAQRMRGFWQLGYCELISWRLRQDPRSTKIRLLQKLTTLSFLATNCPDNWSFEVVRFELLPHVQLAAPRQCVKVAVVALILSPVSTRLHSVSSSTENYNCCESTNLLYGPLVSCCEDGLFRHFNRQLNVIFPGDSGSEAAMKRVLFWGFETEKTFEVLEKLEKTAAGSSSSLTLLTTILPAGSGMFIFGLFLKQTKN